jgi:hypothetical protein
MGRKRKTKAKMQNLSKIDFPKLRRVAAGLIANEIVSVQPMSLPSNVVFYLDYTYGLSQIDFGPEEN